MTSRIPINNSPVYYYEYKPKPNWDQEGDENPNALENVDHSYGHADLHRPGGRPPVRVKVSEDEYHGILSRFTPQDPKHPYRHPACPDPATNGYADLYHNPDGFFYRVPLNAFEYEAILNICPVVRPVVEPAANPRSPAFKPPLDREDRSSSSDAFDDGRTGDRGQNVNCPSCGAHLLLTLQVSDT